MSIEPNLVATETYYKLSSLAYWRSPIRIACWEIHHDFDGGGYAVVCDDGFVEWEGDLPECIDWLHEKLVGGVNEHVHEEVCCGKE